MVARGQNMPIANALVKEDWVPHSPTTFPRDVVGAVKREDIARDSRGRAFDASLSSGMIIQGRIHPVSDMILNCSTS